MSEEEFIDVEFHVISLVNTGNQERADVFFVISEEARVQGMDMEPGTVGVIKQRGAEKWREVEGGFVEFHSVLKKGQTEQLDIAAVKPADVVVSRREDRQGKRMMQVAIDGRCA